MAFSRSLCVRRSPGQGECWLNPACLPQRMSSRFRALPARAGQAGQLSRSRTICSWQGWLPVCVGAWAPLQLDLTRTSTARRERHLKGREMRLHRRNPPQATGFQNSPRSQRVRTEGVWRSPATCRRERDVGDTEAVFSGRELTCQSPLVHSFHLLP